MFNNQPGSLELKSLDLGILYLDQKKHELAMREFSRVLKINPKNNIALIKLGHVYLQQKKFLEAIAQFKKVRELDPKSLDPHEGLGLCYFEQGHIEEALLELNHVLKSAPDNENVRFGLGLCYNQKKEFKKAIEEFSQVLKINPKHLQAKDMLGLCRTQLGHAYFEEKDYLGALSQFEKVLELYSREDSFQKKPDISKYDLMKICLNIGSAYLFMREYKLAVDNLKKASQIEPGNNKINALLSKAYIGIGDYNLGVDILIDCNQASDETFPVNRVDLARQADKIKILRIPNFYGAELLSTEMNSIVMPPLPLGTIAAYARSQGIRLEQDDLHIKIHYDNYFSKDEGKKIDEEVFFDIPRVIRYTKGESDTELDKIMDKVSVKTDFCGYKIILFSLDSCSMNDSHVMFALCLARYLKKKHNPIIILGGLNYFVELMRKNDCDFSDIDYVICYEGEEVIVNLLFSILKLGSFRTQNLKVEENGRVIKSMKVPKPIKPDFDGLPLDRYKYRGLKSDYFSDNTLREVMEEFNRSEVFLLPFRFIKGCTNRCIFCASSVGGLIHAVNPETVALWLEELQVKYDPTGYLFLNDTLNVSKKYLDELCDQIIKRKLNLLWSDCVRTDRLDKDSIYKLRDAGCIRMVFGMETASRKLLDYIKKDIDLKQLEEMLRWADKAGIWTGIEIISGLPYENEKDVDETVSFLKRNKKYVDALYYNAFNIKDTSLIQAYPERYKINNIFELSSYEDGFSTFVKYGFDETSGLKWPQKKKQIISAVNKIIENFGSSPFPEHEYESFLFFLYSRYKDKQTIKNLFYSAGKEKMKYLAPLQRENKEKWKIKESPDRILTYGYGK